MLLKVNNSLSCSLPWCLNSKIHITNRNEKKTIELKKWIKIVFHFLTYLRRRMSSWFLYPWYTESIHSYANISGLIKTCEHVQLTNGDSVHHVAHIKYPLSSPSGTHGNEWTATAGLTQRCLRRIVLL